MNFFMGFVGATRVHINWSGSIKITKKSIINFSRENGEVKSCREKENNNNRTKSCTVIKCNEKERKTKRHALRLHFFYDRAENGSEILRGEARAHFNSSLNIVLRKKRALSTSIVKQKSLRDRNNNRKIDFNWKIKTDFYSNACRFYRNLTPSFSYYWCRATPTLEIL